MLYMLERYGLIALMLLIRTFRLAGTKVRCLTYFSFYFYFFALLAPTLVSFTFLTFDIVMIESGLGRELGEYAIDNYTEIKAVHVNLTAPPPPL